MKSKSLSLLALVLVASLTMGLSGCGSKEGAKEDLGLSKSDGGPKVAPASNDASGSGESPGKLPTTETASSGSGTPGGTSAGSGTGSGSSGSGSGSTGTGTSGSGTSGGSTGGGSQPTSSMRVRILFWNDAKLKEPKGAEIVFGTTSYKPDTSKEAGIGSVGPVPYKTAAALVVYPDGRGGKKIVVPFTVVKSMIANSERDAIHVEISDQKVRVLGNPVDNFEQSFARF